MAYLPHMGDDTATGPAVAQVLPNMTPVASSTPLLYKFGMSPTIWAGVAVGAVGLGYWLKKRKRKGK